MSAPLIDSRTDNPLDAAPMRARQILVLVLAVLLAALDGYDALSMAFVAPVLGRDWGIGKDVIGLLLSSSLVGMAAGAIVLSPVADRLGRRAVVLGAIVLLTIGTALSAAAGSVPMLAAARGLTGIGIGVMVAMTTLISAEFTNARRRSLAVAAVATLGFPLGGVLGGLASSAILKAATWHWVFLTGSICGVVLFLLVASALPESPSFIIARRPADALQRVNRVLARLNQPGIVDLPQKVDHRHGSYGALLAPGLLGVVLRLMATAILIATTSYYIINWLPQMVVDAGFSPAQGSMVSALSGAIGFVGGVGFASLASRFSPIRVAATAMAGAAITLVAVGLVPPVIALFVIAAGALSLCLAGTTGMLYAIMADSFPAALRASGMGLVMGAARIASAAGPATAGMMFAHGMTRAGVSLIFAVGPLVAAALIGTLHRQSSDTARR
ncbi:MFS transporter [Sphingomonas sp. CL5.1]|uniref:MFS transporter n=1 Tax=Sphingomonas sp. CL5.1 TaxID=2653203 RepID=UPI001582C9A2|nr:MFS transporter [Sphingomonas sp. CL5.1]QKR99796.1 MFS transporter [Sphingomonas sp. CL5.1]